MPGVRPRKGSVWTPKHAVRKSIQYEELGFTPWDTSAGHAVEASDEYSFATSPTLEASAADDWRTIMQLSPDEPTPREEELSPR